MLQLWPCVPPGGAASTHAGAAACGHGCLHACAGVLTPHVHGLQGYAACGSTRCYGTLHLYLWP